MPNDPNAAQAGQLDTSLIVETYNYLEGTSLESVRAVLKAAFDFKPPAGGLEVLLADVTRDSAIARMLASEFPAARRVDAFGLGYDEAKRLAAEAARGKYVVYLDCDCLPETHWLERITLPLRQGRADASGGMARYPGGFFARLCWLMDFGFLLPNRERQLGCYASNNSAFLRQVLLENPEPDGAMRCRCYAHSQALMRRGIRLLLAEGATVWHEPPPFFRERLRQGYDMVAACWVDPQLRQARWLRRGIVAAPKFYRWRLKLDFGTLRECCTEVGLTRFQRRLAFPLLTLFRLIDLIGACATLALGPRARRWVDPAPKALDGRVLAQ